MRYAAALLERTDLFQILNQLFFQTNFLLLHGHLDSTLANPEDMGAAQDTASPLRIFSRIAMGMRVLRVVSYESCEQLSKGTFARKEQSNN